MEGIAGIDSAITALLGAGSVGGVLILVRAWRMHRSGAITDNRSIAGDYKTEATEQRERAELAERRSARWRTQAHRYRVQILLGSIEPRDDPIMVADLEDPK